MALQQVSSAFGDCGFLPWDARRLKKHTLSCHRRCDVMMGERHALPEEDQEQEESECSWDASMRLPFPDIILPNSGSVAAVFGACLG
jgi:hypothetical protein